MDTALAADLAATCNALGYYDSISDKYLIDDCSLETVKDLIRHLRRDNAEFTIRRWLGETNVLQTDLLPMLKDHGSDSHTFDVILRLLVNLTNPVLLLFHEEPPDDKVSHKYFLEIITYLQAYKEAFTDRSVWMMISDRLSSLLSKEILERDEDSSLNIERILILIRNVLNVADNSNVASIGASVHDRVLCSLDRSKIADSLLKIAGSSDEKIFYMHVLEIVSLMYREQSPEDLARFQIHNSNDNNILAKFVEEERLTSIKRNKLVSGRHSNFGGTVVLQDIKGISDQNLIVHKPLSNLSDLNLDKGKKRIKVPKNRALIEDKPIIRQSDAKVRMFLKQFAINFLKNAYNTLMFHVRGCFVRGKAQEHDESYYLWALRFFMEFNRCYKFQANLIKETLSAQIYYFVQQQIERYFDILRMEKKKAAIWTKRLHLALQAYRELLTSITMMDKDMDATVREAAKAIKNEIFYVQEYRELILTLFLTFNETQVSYSYLCDLIEAQFIFLRTLERYCTAEKASIIVEKHKTIRAKKKTKNAKNEENAINSTISSLQTQSDDHWNEITNMLEDILSSSNTLVDVIPFDAASDVSIDDQKEFAMRKIQMNLQQKELEPAVSLLRAAREVWLDPESLGSNESSLEEELLLLKEIYFKRFEGNVPTSNVNISLLDEQPDFIEDGTEFSDGEAEDDEKNKCVVETVFNFEDFLRRFANPKVIKVCGLSLNKFEENSKMTNFSLVKLMHRIAWDCRMPALFFQASIFRSFQRLIPLKHLYPELHKFAMFITKKFVEVANKNPKVYVEFLFWKSSRDAYDIEEGYGSYKEKSKIKSVWSEEQESELQVLHEEYHSKQVDEDMVDWIKNNLIDQRKTRRTVIIQLKKMGLLGDYKRKSKRKGTKKATNVAIGDESNADSNSKSESESESDGDNGNENENSNNRDSRLREKSESEEDIDWDKLRANRLGSKTRQNGDISDSDSSQDSVIPDSEPKKYSQNDDKLNVQESENRVNRNNDSQNLNSVTIIDSSESSNEEGTVNLSKNANHSRRIHLIVDESDSDNNTVSILENEKGVADSENSSDNENRPIKKKKYLKKIESDSEEENDTPTLKKIKTNIVYDSD